MHRHFLGMCVILSAMFLHPVSGQNSNCETSLSRKKRYLLFPEGSSLQLVYDTTFPIVVGAAPFVFGSTAAVAWELPYDLIGPLLDLKNRGKLRRVDKPGTTSIWKPEKPRIHTLRRPQVTQSSHFLPDYMHYYKPIRYANNVFQNSAAHRLVQNRKHSYNRRVNYGIRKNYYRNKGYTTNYSPIYNEVHRRTRRQLFTKVERFFTAQRKDGRACLLRTVCEVSRATNDRGTGTFVAEIIKAIFRFHRSHTGKENDVYDAAAMKLHNCTELYPTCDFSLWSMFG